MPLRLGKVTYPFNGYGWEELPKQENSLALDIKEKLTKIQYNQAEDTFGWMVKV